MCVSFRSQAGGCRPASTPHAQTTTRRTTFLPPPTLPTQTSPATRLGVSFTFDSHDILPVPPPPRLYPQDSTHPTTILHTMHAGRILSISVPNSSSVPDASFSQRQQQQQQQQQKTQAEEQEEAARCRRKRTASLVAAGRALSASSLVTEKRQADKTTATEAGAGAGAGEAGKGRGGVPRLGQPPNAQDDAALVRLLAGLQQEADNLTNSHSSSSSSSIASSSSAPPLHPHHSQGARLEALEALLESGEGTDIELHPSSRPSSSSPSPRSSRSSSSTTSAFPPPLTLHSNITRHGTRIFRPKTRVQVPWSSPVTHALATFLYTGRLALSTAHLADVYQAAQEAGVRSLVYLLRTYPFYALRLTSAEKAR